MARMAATPSDSETRKFTLAQARLLMPEVRRVTREAVEALEHLQRDLAGRESPSPELVARVEGEMRDAVQGWASSIERLGAVAKGLWLVDFDNGAGYFCWQHPEPELSHYHDYEAGFAGRTPIQ